MLTLNPIELNRMSADELRTSKMILQNTLSLLDDLIAKKVVATEDVEFPCRIRFTSLHEVFPDDMSLLIIRSLRTVFHDMGLAEAKAIHDKLKANGTTELSLNSWSARVRRSDLNSLMKLNIKTEVLPFC